MCKGLLSRTPHSSHLGTGSFIFFTTLQVHPLCALLRTPAGCSCLGNARCEGASRLCPLSLCAAHAEKALRGFWWLRASWSPSCHCELHGSKRHLGMLSQGSKQSYFCEAGLGEQACPYDHGRKISSSRLKTHLPPHARQRALCIPLARHPTREKMSQIAWGGATAEAAAIKQ